MTWSAPELLNKQHVVADFDCGYPVLNDWLRKHALKNQLSRASRTFVVCQGLQVKAFYAMASGSVSHQEAIGSVRRNMPNPIPVIVLGRLAVDRSAQGCGLGSACLKDAVLRAQMVCNHIGAKALLVHAIDEQAAAFYQNYGFQPSPIHPLTLMLRLE